jgi:hypothetical protein
MLKSTAVVVAAVAAAIVFGYGAAAVFSTDAGRLTVVLLAAAIVFGSTIVSPGHTRRTDSWQR